MAGSERERRLADVVRRSRIRSRALHGRPGQGRKTRHVDRRRQSLRDACRGGRPPEE